MPPPSFQMFQYQYRPWAPLTLDRQHRPSWPWTLLLPYLDRSNVSNPLHIPSDIYVLSSRLLSREAPRPRTTACQRSRSSSSKGIILERLIRVTVSHLTTIGSLHLQPKLSSRFPFLPSIFPRPLQASCRHRLQHSTPNLMPLTFVSFTTIPSTPLVGMSMHSVAPSSPAFHRMRHT